MRIGILLGRFQPLHPGHINLIKYILSHNDFLRICIGSAQLADPFTVEERRDLISRQLAVLSITERVRIFELIDPQPIESWPDVLASLCEVNPDDSNVFYRSDQLEPRYIERLGQLGVKVEIVSRGDFYYKAPDGLYHLISSATEIKALHRKNSVPLKLKG